MLTDFKDEDFDNKIKNEDISVIQFSAAWCGPCKALKPIMDKLAVEYKDKAGFYYADIEEGGINTGSAAGIRGVPTVIIYKKGEKGSITFAMNKEIKKGIFPVKPLKPTGAGDAFMGSLIGSILKTNDLEKSIEIGSAAAAIVVTKVGCAPAMPNLNEILEFMKYNKINEGE